MSSRNAWTGRWRLRCAAVALAISSALGVSSNAVASAADEALQRGSELLAAGEPEQATQAFRDALAADPNSVEAHLGLARSYYALGEYARAVIEFEAVLRFENLPRDVQSQAETYDRVAEEYVARGWAPFFYGETGIGNYRQNSSGSTDIFGGAGNYDTFLPIRVGGGWSTALTERHSLNGTLDYRFRWYDDKDRRNDSDWRWNVNLSRPVDDDSLRFGVRGRVSYRGDGRHRNDWGVFATYDLGLGPNDRLTLGGELRERRYPRGPLRNRTRDIAEFTAGWSHSLANGRTSFGLGGAFGQEWATQERIDGDNTFWSVNGSFDHSFSDSLDLFLWAEYVNEAFDEERPDFTTDPDLLLERTDDLVYVGGGLVWRFAPGWSLRPTFEYDWEGSNIPALEYSKTEVWLTVRKSL